MHTWQLDLKESIQDPKILLDLLQLTDQLQDKINTTAFPFGLRVTKSFIKKMKQGDPQDPLLLQVLPLKKEEVIKKGFIKDPLGESICNPIPGLLHKYKTRVLITVTGGCAIHCRYCFRRHFPYQSNIPGRNIDTILEYIRQHTDISEIILSGGDPLLSTDDYLQNLVTQLASIAHVQLLRIHSRLPIVLPTRIHETLIKVLLSTRLQPIVIVHCNHANEIDATVGEKLYNLVQAGITVLNQTVLLYRVNDSVEALEALSYTLFRYRVLPYYLHCLDPVQGAAHFSYSITRAKALYYTLRERLPGYLVPLLVKEEKNTLYKRPMV